MFKNVIYYVWSSLLPLVLNVAQISNPATNFHLAGTCHCVTYLARKFKKIHSQPKSQPKTTAIVVVLPKTFFYSILF